MNAVLAWVGQNPRLGIVAGVAVMLVIVILGAALVGAAERSQGMDR